MDETRDVKVQDIMEQIRENLRKKRQDSSLSSSSDGQAAADLGLLRSGEDLTRITFTSHRKWVGPFVVLAKKVLRQLLTPILERQMAYNAANTRLTAFLMDQVASLDSEQAQLRDQHAQLRDELPRLHAEQAQLREELPRLRAAKVQLREELARLHEQQAQLRDELPRLHEQQTQLRDELPRLHAEVAKLREASVVFGQRHDQALQVLREQVARAERKLRRIIYSMTESPEAKGPVQMEPRRVPRRELDPDFDYPGMEERFRGSEEEIKERQRKYLEHFRGSEQVLDVGCGRGEFLELLREAGIKARGVDTNLDMMLLCREKGLDAAHGDAFAYLESLPDESLDGIFAAMFIEHLLPGDIINFIRLCHGKLKPKGVLLLETPNPKCLTTLAWAFYVDFSHLWPCHPDAMRYVLESSGFKDIQLEFSSPVLPNEGIPFVRDPATFGEETDRFNRAAQFLNELIFGYQDYAIIGRRI